jgi:hypothetical protein
MLPFARSILILDQDNASGRYAVLLTSWEGQRLPDATARALFLALPCEFKVCAATMVPQRVFPHLGLRLDRRAGLHGAVDDLDAGRPLEGVSLSLDSHLFTQKSNQCEAYTFLAGSIGSLSLTLWFIPILYVIVESNEIYS